MLNQVYNMLEQIGRHILRKPSITGLEHVTCNVPAVFVANHAGVYGPVSMKLFFPVSFVPWVIYNVVDKDLCLHYLKTNFFEKQLGWHPLISRAAAAIVGRICVAIMKHIGAIPVYRGKKRIFDTIELSVEALKKGRNIVVFIDDQVIEANDFKRGFICIAKIFYEKCKKPIIFYPVYIHKDKRVISVKPGIWFNPNNPYRKEILRIRNYLNSCMTKTL